MRRGFTLAELSIVLVVVGLLIGGILVAQSMIETVTITQQIRQLQQFDIAVSNFKLQFGTIPGDSNKFISNFGSTGNNDGILQTNNLYHNIYEHTQFWPQLSQSGILQYNYIGGSNGPCIIGGVHVPKAKLPAMRLDPANVGTCGIGPLIVLAYGIGPSLYYSIGSIGYYNNGPLQAGVTPARLQSIDSKTDDGIGSTGKVIARGWYPPYGQFSYSGADTGSGCLSPSGAYKTSITGGYNNGCVARIDMLYSVDQ